MSQRFSRLIFAVVPGLLALGGCSSHRQLAVQAVDFNLTVEKAQNEMLLLNVIRAKDRLPMYMTGIASLSGNVSTSFSAGVPGTYISSKGIGIDTITRSVTPSPGAAISANPTFSLAVLDTQEFMRGFLAPVSTDLLAYYWNRGWPLDLLMYLLVQEVEIVPQGGGPTQVLRNYPDSADTNLDGVKSFGSWLQKFLAGNPRLVNVTTWANVGPPLLKDSVSDAGKLIQITKEGMRLCPFQEQDKDFYQLQSSRTELRFAREPESGPSKACNPKETATVAPDAGKIDTTLEDSKTASFVLRSPEGLVYYLGELMRVANRSKSPKIAYLCIQGHMQPIFVAFPTGRCKDTQVQADAGRGGYSVPQSLEPGDEKECKEGELQLVDATSEKSCEGGRSMQALRLLSQLMSLQKSAKDMPSAAVVRLIN
ncbi:MAG: hypothetical protein WAM82_12050 [Thermoanaerobaculia bacterium]